MSQPILFEHPPVRVKACRHGVMMYNTTDQYVGRSLDRYGEFSEGETELFRQIVRPGMVVLDVGANIGAHTLYFAKAVGNTGGVYAFEPQRPVHQMLCGNVALNALGNVIAQQAALGREKGTILVPMTDYAKEGNFGGLALGEWKRGEPVPVLTLDLLELRQCHVIKIDVEGMEREVLAGAVRTLARHQPLLYVENDRAQHSAALITDLFALGYRLFWHLPPLFNPRNHFGDSVNIFGRTVSVNMFGVPRSRPLTVNGLREVTSAEDTWRS